MYPYLKMIWDFSLNPQISSCGDILRDCRKSPEMAILANSHVMKSISYKYQILRFRVFRQSLRISNFH